MRRLLVATVLLAATPAFAGEREAAEHTQRYEEMQRLASRGAWAGVERAFVAIEALESKGEVLTYDDLWLGAQSARALGHIADCRDRLARAAQLQGTQDVISWLEEIDGAYGAVDLGYDKSLTADLAIAAMPFATDQREAIAYAKAELSESRSFDGLLPAGEYTLGDESFTVSAGGETVKVFLDPYGGGESGEGGDGFAFAYVGPRAHVGGAFTAIGDPVRSDSIQPPGWTGAGARAGVGLEVGLPRRFGVAAEVGYHGLVLGGDGETDGGVTHLGYGALGPTYRPVDKVWLGVSGILAAGTARAVGVYDLDKVNEDCPFGSDSPDCAFVSAVAEERRAEMPWDTNAFQPGGFSASASYAAFDITDELAGVVTLHGGMLLDPYRNCPFAQVGFGIGPTLASREAK